MISRDRIRSLALAALVLGCNGTAQSLRAQAARGDIAGALQSYERHVRERGASHPDAVQGIASAVLEQSARSDSVRGRNAAFSTLRSLGSRGRDILVDLANTPGIVGDRAASVIYEIDGREGEPPARLLAASQSLEPERRIAGLVVFEGRRDLLGLVAALDAESPEVRRSAALRMGRWRDNPTVIERLGDCLRTDRDDGVRATCVSSLGSQGPTAFDRIVAAREDSSGFVRMAAMSALVSADLNRAKPLLAPLMATPSTESVELARALAARGDEPAIAHVFEVLAGANPALRAQAAVAVSGLGERYEERLVTFVTDSDVEVKLRVAAALGRGGRRRDVAIANLRPLAVSSDPLLAMRALLLLAELRDAAVTPAVRQALLSEQETIARLAVLAWSHLAGLSGEIDPLLPLLLRRDVGVRVLAAGEILRIASR
ncbi:MAG: HEAT repeat domain-containing protein [Deltaproteobacteria bacterium]|nr:HEAT repeat domain-containing protein [Deltaproteobacteria bacterium]